MKECACGCGGKVKGQRDFLPGHDEYLRSAVMYLLGRNSVALGPIFGFGPGLRNAKAFVTERRKAEAAEAKAAKVAV